MKKILIILMTVLALTVFTACESKEVEIAEETTVVTSEKNNKFKGTGYTLVVDSEKWVFDSENKNAEDDALSLYTNDMILATVDNILAKDPDAVILLQADHGSRQPGHLVDQYGGPWFDGEIENPMMASVLNCVRVPGGSPDIEGDTCINAARKTFNAAFGTGFDMLEVPPMYEIPREYMPKEPKPEGEAA